MPSAAASWSTIILQTAAPEIFALGECAEHRGICYGLVEPAYEQARVLAQHLAGKTAAYGGSVVATNLKVSGVSVFSAGDFHRRGGQRNHPAQRCQARHLQEAGDLGRTAHRRGAGRRCRDALWYLELIRSREPVAAIRRDMMFGRAVAIRPKAA